MYKEEAVEEAEAFAKLPFKEKYKRRYKYYLMYVINSMIIFAIIYCCDLYYKENEKNRKLQRYAGEYYEESVDEINFNSYSLDNLFYNTRNNTIMNLSFLNSDGNVYYSLFHNKENNENDKLHLTSTFVKGNMTSLLIHGYPYVSYTDMGFDNKEDAYIATQLAVYELVASQNYSENDGNFSLDDLRPVSNVDTNRFEKIISKAKELHEISLNEPYEYIPEIYTEFLDYSITPTDNGSYALGPFRVTKTTDEYTKKFLNNNVSDDIDIDIIPLAGESKGMIVDENGNSINDLKNRDIFYVLISSKDKIFSIMNTNLYTESLGSYIYKTEDLKTSYVTLDVSKNEFSDVFSLLYGVEHGTLNVNCLYNNETIYNVKYKIYGEDDTLISDYSGPLELDLPVGKYYIKVYSLPQGYFYSDKKIEFEIKKDNTTSLNIIPENIKDASK